MKLWFALPLAVALSACAVESEDSSSEDPNEDSAQESSDLKAKVTYAKEGPIVTATCGGCHQEFTTLAGIKASKTEMIAQLTAGTMPQGNPAWKKTADGKGVLKWLKTGTDLK